MLDQKTKILATLALISVGLGLLVIFQVQSLGKLRLVFCDVGQGDGILIISPGGRQIVIDGGPGNKMVDCLGQKMPFWDRTIEMVVLTHPQKDHLEGLLGVLERYKVQMIATTQVANQTELFEVWQKATRAEGAKIHVPKAGDKLILDSIRGRTSSIDVLWPTEEKLDIWKLSALSELNESSIVVRVNYGQFCAYLTGDLPKTDLKLALQGEALRGCEMLKISHHGSRTGTDGNILELTRPQIAVIQVGKNSYGHPHKEVIDLLKLHNIKIFRNDINGIVEVQTNGVSFKTKTEMSGPN